MLAPLLAVLLAGAARGTDSPWTVVRDPEQPRASARASRGARVGQLAVEMGLNPAEFNRWLAFAPEVRQVALADGRVLSTKELRPEHELAEGTVVLVPNSIVAVWVPGVGRIGQILVDWDDDLAYLRHRGFKVERFDAPEGRGDPGFGDRVTRAVVDLGHGRALHGVFITAHGNGRVVGDNCGTFIWLDHFDLQYRLGFALINTCEGERALAKLASPHAATYGVPQTLVPPFESGHPSEILPAGAQGTRPAPRRPSRRPS